MICRPEEEGFDVVKCRMEDKRDVLLDPSLNGQRLHFFLAAAFH